MPRWRSLHSSIFLTPKPLCFPEKEKRKGAKKQMTRWNQEESQRENEQPGQKNGKQLMLLEDDDRLAESEKGQTQFKGSNAVHLVTTDDETAHTFNHPQAPHQFPPPPTPTQGPLLSLIRYLTGGIGCVSGRALTWVPARGRRWRPRALFF